VEKKRIRRERKPQQDSFKPRTGLAPQSSFGVLLLPKGENLNESGKVTNAGGEKKEGNRGGRGGEEGRLGRDPEHCNSLCEIASMLHTYHNRHRQRQEEKGEMLRGGL